MTVQLSPPRLLVITPPDPLGVDLVGMLPALRGIADAVLLRWPALPADAIRRRAAGLAHLKQRPPLLLSGDPELAKALGLEGVHLKDDGSSVSSVRRRQPGLLVGASRHDVGALRSAAGADYVSCSPVMATKSKPQATPLGLEGLAHCCARSPCPVLALGGIRAEHVGACLRAGASGVAVLSAVWGAEHPIEAARQLERELRRGGSSEA